MATLDVGPARSAPGETLRTAAYGEFAECERVDFEACDTPQLRRKSNAICALC
jgi:hypothetical protein